MFRFICLLEICREEESQSRKLIIDEADLITTGDFCPGVWESYRRPCVQET